ncbi:MAG: AMP-binding protein, partial [Pseudonocardia sp.]|nr:AMP-binding protein [Pseudonocardia sp.]
MQTIPAALARAATRWPAGEALVDGDVRLDWAGLHHRVRTLARFFVAEGVQPGDRVAVQAPNTHHWVLAALGALYTGATLVPVSTRFTAAEALDVLHRTRARALVIAERFLGVERLADLRAAGLTGPPTVLRVPQTARESGVSAHRVAVMSTPAAAGPSVDGIGWDRIDERAGRAGDEDVQARADAVRPDQVSDILFTSGTTGRSKGAMSSHAQALGVADAWAECGELTDADRYLVINPFFHSFGYKAGILACLLRGATIIPMPVFDVERALELIERERITVLPGPPTLFRSMLDSPARARHDLSSLRFAVTGAATVPVALVEEMRRELGFDLVLTAYGLTEAVVATMCRAGDDARTVAHTCGRAAAGFELRLAEETNEVLLRGPNVM